ncbi:GNAT family N-acetyltransferase [Vreelandella populi]|uniref:N-acetyltransferase n=1 Tax=Vreelandella populi TaxID=2498858 RepID=A0A3S0WLQ6_9GAMM|nr:GNAT family N-acetyltransferase [Halomonas populi]RUR40834.1 N-acetyltransferase [Halomonas populi]RUR49341.1 N-acetyltransferase [Halomonas populi]
MDYLEVNASAVPIQLLLEADPSEQNIASYLDGAWCFAAKLDGKIAGACVAKAISNNTAEIFNIAVYPQFQQQGLGSGLLRFALGELKNKNMQRVELSTGTFGYQLTYYQRHGFRVDRVVKNHFLDHYPEPIFENGMQHQDALRLYVVFKW